MRDKNIKGALDKVEGGALTGPPSDLVHGRGLSQPIRSSQNFYNQLDLKMQLTNLPESKYFDQIEKFIQSERLLRYCGAARGDKGKAFSYYVWNCDLSQSFYKPLHFAEIGSRNAIHSCLLANLGNDWYKNRTLHNILDQRFSVELNDVIQNETAQHGVSLTAHHIVSALTFGFWEHLLTKRFERILWKQGVHIFFPGTSKFVTRDILRSRLESVRRWRNRIAHHRAIFDKSPSQKYKEIVELIEWACPATSVWVKSVAPVQSIINQRPS